MLSAPTQPATTNDTTNEHEASSRTDGQTPSGDGGRAVVTLSPPAAAAARRLALKMGRPSLPEVVRRGLMLLDVYLSLGDDEELVIRDRRNGQLERIRFTWETF